MNFAVSAVDNKLSWYYLHKSNITYRNNYEEREKKKLNLKREISTTSTFRSYERGINVIYAIVQKKFYILVEFQLVISHCDGSGGGGGCFDHELCSQQL